MCAIHWKARRDRWDTAFVVSVAVVAVAENFGLIRDLLDARMPDAIVPAVVLGAWLAHRAWLARPRYVWIPAVVAVLLGTGLAITHFGERLREEMNRAGLTLQIWQHPGWLPTRLAERSATLHDRFAADPPSRAMSAPDAVCRVCRPLHHRTASSVPRRHDSRSGLFRTAAVCGRRVRTSQL